jgi:hypothetical protein
MTFKIILFTLNNYIRIYLFVKLNLSSTFMVRSSEYNGFPYTSSRAVTPKLQMSALEYNYII